MYYYEKKQQQQQKNAIKIKVSAKRVHTLLVLTPLHSSTTWSLSDVTLHTHAVTQSEAD